MRKLGSALILVAGLGVAGCGSSGGSSGGGSQMSTAASTTKPASTTSPSSTASTPAAAGSSAPASANHTFSNYHRSCPGANGVMQATDSSGPTAPLTSPWTDHDEPGPNDFSNAHTDWNNGAMDSFDKGEETSFYGFLAKLMGGPFVT